jgi:hypothetical protein
MTDVANRFWKFDQVAGLASFFFLAGLFLSGCATQSFAPEVAPEYVAIRDFSPFYRLGPQQGRGPDATLRTGTRVKMLRKEMGFSLVQMEDLRTGYVANENLAVAPPRPPEQVRQESEAVSQKKRSGRQRGDNGPLYSGPAVNDTLLPDRNVPPPDLNVEPEIMPKSIPAPDATPIAKPKFLY